MHSKVFTALVASLVLGFGAVLTGCNEDQNKTESAPATQDKTGTPTNTSATPSTPAPPAPATGDKAATEKAAPAPSDKAAAPAPSTSKPAAPESQPANPPAK